MDSLFNEEPGEFRIIAGRLAADADFPAVGAAHGDYPEFAQFLVEQGIHSISLNPDTVLKTTLAIIATEHAITR